MSINNKIKKTVNKILSRTGFEIQRSNLINRSDIQFQTILEINSIDLIFDIGANEGQFAKKIRRFGYKKTIVSFEPIPDAHKKLLKNAENDSDWIIHDACAIGDFDGKIDLNISENSVSSSILEIKEAHLKSAPASRYLSKIQTPIWKLDTVGYKYLKDHHRYLLKIDTQGFEWNVLQGATDILKGAKAVKIELSLLSLYDGQKLWLDIINFLEKIDFSLWMIESGFTDQEKGRTLQIDGVFIREKLLVQQNNYQFNCIFK